MVTLHPSIELKNKKKISLCVLVETNIIAIIVFGGAQTILLPGHPDGSFRRKIAPGIPC